VRIVDVTLGNNHQVDFGDAQITPGPFATIYGTVFDDENGNGKKEDSEMGMPGVKVTLDGTSSNFTNAFGIYSFTTNITGSHLYYYHYKVGVRKHQIYVLQWARLILPLLADQEIKGKTALQQ